MLAAMLWGELALADDEMIEFNISSQRADKALTAFAQTANLPVLFPNKDIRKSPLMTYVGDIR